MGNKIFRSCCGYGFNYFIHKQVCAYQQPKSTKQANLTKKVWIVDKERCG